MGCLSAQSGSEYGSREKEAKLAGMVGPGKSKGTSTSTKSRMEEDAADGAAEVRQVMQHATVRRRRASEGECAAGVEVHDVKWGGGAVIVVWRRGWPVQQWSGLARRGDGGEVEDPKWME